MKKKLVLFLLVFISIFTLVACGKDPVIEFWNSYEKAVNSQNLDEVAKKFAITEDTIEAFKTENANYFDIVSKIDTKKVTKVTECKFSSDLYTNNYYLLNVDACINGGSQINFNAYIREENAGMFFCSNFDFENETGNEPDALWLKSAFYSNEDYQYKFDETLTSGTFVKTMKNPKNFIIPEEIDGIPVTTIYNYAFYKCRKILSFTLSSSKLQNVTIPETVTSINDYAFYQCTKLKQIDIPASVTNIGVMAFTGSKRIETINLFTESLKVEDAQNAKAENSGSAFKIKGGRDMLIGDIIQLSSDLNSVTWSAGGSTLVSLDSDTGKVVALGAGSVTITGTGVDSNKKKVQATITLTITACPQVLKINFDAFDRLPGLKSLYIFATNPNSLYIVNGTNALNLNKTVKIYVPEGSGDMYKESNSWKAYADQIVEME